MYAKLPRVASNAVSDGSLRWPLGLRIFETPKSRMRVRSSLSSFAISRALRRRFSMKRFAGLMSRWTTPALCAAPRPWSASSTIGRHLGEREVLLAPEALVEPLAREELERDPEPPVAVLPGPEDVRDVRRLDLRGDGRLPVEARDEVLVLRRLVVQDLDGDLLAALAVGGVDLAHAARADEAPHLVDAPQRRCRRGSPDRATSHRGC